MSRGGIHSSHNHICFGLGIYKIQKIAPLTRYGRKLTRGMLWTIAPVSITQAQIRPLWLVSQTSLSFLDVTFPVQT
jgi:hypothetical protein